MPRFWLQAPGGDRTFESEREELLLGRGEGADIPVEDPRVSRSHCVIRRLGSAWILHDLGSANGTLLNGGLVSGGVALRTGDVVTLGDTRIVVEVPDPDGASTTLEEVTPPPPLTPREQEVLAALCAPLLDGMPFAEPASVRQIADGLFVTSDNVKKYLARLYEKFEIPADEGMRRAMLARKAILLHAVRRSGPRR